MSDREVVPVNTPIRVDDRNPRRSRWFTKR
jgi:hypothetical protein